jgi:hypothetical protein
VIGQPQDVEARLFDAQGSVSNLRVRRASPISHIAGPEILGQTHHGANLHSAHGATELTLASALLRITERLHEQCTAQHPEAPAAGGAVTALVLRTDQENAD